jgi:signal transduction histidine kinase
MTRSFFLLLFLLGKASWCAAQLPLNEHEYADSLNRVLQQSVSDSAKARTNFILSYYWSEKDTAKAQYHLEEGTRLSRKHPFLEGLSIFYAASYYFDVDAAKAEGLYLQADSLLKRIKTKEAFLFRSKAWHSYAVLQNQKGDDKAVIDILLNKCIPLAEQGGDSVLVGDNYMHAGILFMNNQQYDKAETYYKKALPFLKNAPPTSPVLVRTYMCAATNYTYSKQYPEAKAMLDSAKKILAPFPHSSELPQYYKEEGVYYYAVEEYEKSLQSYEKGIAMARELKQTYNEQVMLFEKYNTLHKLKRYNEAIKVLHYLQGEKTFMRSAGNRQDMYAELAKTYAAMNNMGQAYKWLYQYAELSDSVFESRLKTDINALEIKYKNAEHQKQILSLKAANEKAALTIENSRLISWFLGSVCVLLLVIAVFAILYYRNNKKLSQQHLKEIEQQQQIKFSQAMLQGEEQERRRVARDLHDGLGGMLAGVKINLSGIAASQHTELNKVINQLDNSVIELRRIARNLMPEALLKFGLETALKDLCESLMSENLRIEFQAFGIEASIPEQTQVTIYRIVQELLANAIRHANATNIVLQCSQNGNSFFITVEDNGKGFDARSINDIKGLGLNNIKSRVDYLKGKMDIVSTVKEGTTINIELNV